MSHALLALALLLPDPLSQQRGSAPRSSEAPVPFTATTPADSSTLPPGEVGRRPGEGEPQQRGPAPGSSQAPDPFVDITPQIQSLLNTQVNAWNHADLDGFLATYWNSPDLVFQSGGTRTKGFEPTRDRYKTRYQSEGRAMGQLAFTDIQIEPLNDSTAYAYGRWQLTLPDDTKPSGLFTLILKKLPEGWRITHDHTSSADEP